jgi:hypothetical protein
MRPDHETSEVADMKTQIRLHPRHVIITLILLLLLLIIATVAARVA